MTDVICDICKNPITVEDVESNNFNKLFGKYTHKSCDEDIMIRIEKGIRYPQEIEMF